MKTQSHLENGQAIVLLVISLVVLLGFTALALDGGMVYSDRRLAQNIADTAALAGGGEAASGLVEQNVLYSDFMERCNSGYFNNLLSRAEQTALARMETNTQNLDIEDFDVDAICAEDVDSRQRYIEVRATIISNTPTSMAHLLFSGPLRSTVEAVTRVTPFTPFYEGHAIVSLNNTCTGGGKGGVEVEGGGGSTPTNIYISGGGIHSNSCVYANGNTRVHVNNGTIDYVDSISEFNNAQVSASGGFNDDAEIYPIEVIDVICPTTVSPTPSFTNDYPENAPLQPGRYSQIRRTGGQMNLAPGLYCVDGDVTININGGAGEYFRGEGVTFYLPSGNFSVAASSTVNLSAPNDCPTRGCEGGGIEGILIYLGIGNTGTVRLLGTASSSYTGTVYAPTGTVEVGGSGELVDGHDTEFYTQLIANTVNVHGNASINITYDLNESRAQPAKMDLYR
jgi:hypothetical protein